MFNTMNYVQSWIPVYLDGTMFVTVVHAIMILSSNVCDKLCKFAEQNVCNFLVFCKLISLIGVCVIVSNGTYNS